MCDCARFVEIDTEAVCAAPIYTVRKWQNQEANPDTVPADPQGQRENCPPVEN